MLIIVIVNNVMVVSWGFYLVENFDREIFVFGVVDL